VLDGMGREGSYHNQYYTWTKEFLEAGKRKVERRKPAELNVARYAQILTWQQRKLISIGRRNALAAIRGGQRQSDVHK
jgi:hypothetical protein